MEKTHYDVIIVGAGASGLVCAIDSARQGKSVLILEKEHQPARKISVSGNGRCNLTNAHVSENFYNGDRKLAARILQTFSYHDCLSFFSSLGVLAVEEGQGRVFPASGKSTAVTEALKLAAAEAGADLLTEQEVVKIKKQKYFLVYTKQELQFSSACCVLACGSCAYPQLSGTHAGYDLAKSLGHRINPPLPAITALNIKEKAVARLQGIRAQAIVRAFSATQEIDRSEGEVLFTNYGVSGPAILNISAAVSRALKNGGVTLKINFLPEIKNLEVYLNERLQTFGARKAKDFFAGLLHENIANLLIDFTGVKKNIPVQEWTPNTWKQAIYTVGAWPFSVLSPRPWTEAMAATGGVNTAEINYNNFESLLCNGLFITGELLDVDGKSGGFNLHFAWGSGKAAAAGIGGLDIW